MEGISQYPKPNRGIRVGGVSGVLNPRQSPLHESASKIKPKQQPSVPYVCRFSFSGLDLSPPSTFATSALGDFAPQRSRFGFHPVQRARVVIFSATFRISHAHPDRRVVILRYE